MDVDTSEADRWYADRIAQLKVQYDAKTLWDIPKDVWHEAQAKHADMLRVAYGRDPQTGEKTAERVKMDRQVEVEADTGIPKELVQRRDRIASVLERLKRP